MKEAKPRRKAYGTNYYAHNFLPELAAQAWDQGMPRSLIPVCQAAEGLYAIAQDGQIVFWVPGEGVNEDEEWSSIWQWAREVWLES